MASSIRNLHASQSGDNKFRRLGQRAIDLLKEAHGEKRPNAGKLCTLIDRHVWWVRQQGASLFIKVHNERTAYRAEWRIALFNGQVATIRETGEFDEDVPAEEVA